MFSMVLPVMSTSPEAAFNFMDVALCNQPLPQNYTGYLEEFFQSVFKKHVELKLDPKSAFEIAVECLSARFLDSFLHHMVRNNMEIRPGIPDKFKYYIQEVERAIMKFVPCDAIHKFDQLEGLVCCESYASEHGNIHQSSRTYQETIVQGGFFGMFGKKQTITQACRWYGETEVPSKYSTSGWLSNMPGIHTLSQSAVDRDSFFAGHIDLLDKQRDILSHIQTHRLCLACVLDIPTERLVCNHLLCISCCQEIEANGKLVCPFCDIQGYWSIQNIPAGAGVRLLTLDGGGIRGLVSAMMMTRIENQLGVPCHQLFDLIVGTSSGGLNALGLGARQLSGSKMFNAFKEFSRKAFQKSSYFSFARYMYGYKYLRGPLHNALAEFLPDEPMLGSTKSPKVAVVACEMSEGKTRLVLFTTYNVSNNSIYRRETRATLLQAAEATSSAGSYFPVQKIILSKNEGKKVQI